MNKFIISVVIGVALSGPAASSSENLAQELADSVEVYADLGLKYGRKCIKDLEAGEIPNESVNCSNYVVVMNRFERSAAQAVILIEQLEGSDGPGMRRINSVFDVLTQQAVEIVKAAP